MGKMYSTNRYAVASHLCITPLKNIVNKEDRVMQTVLTPSTISDARNLVVALFMNIQDARGAIADLADAGFGKSQIRVIFSDQVKIVIRENSEVKTVGKQTTLDGEKSLVWKLRRSFKHDLHRSDRPDDWTGSESIFQQWCSLIFGSEPWRSAVAAWSCGRYDWSAESRDGP